METTGHVGAERLPSGRHGLPKAAVIRSQRERLTNAVIATVAERGYTSTTVGDVIARAGVSRATFYQLYESKEECFIVAHDELIQQLVSYVRGAFDGPDRWPDQVRAGYAALLHFLAANPDAARVAIVEILGAGPRGHEHHRAAIRSFVPFFEDGRRGSPLGDRVPQSAARVIVGGAATIIFEEVVAGNAEDLPRLLPELLYLALAPYLGHEAAVAEMQELPHPMISAPGQEDPAEHD